jgi:endonuclease G, mitochondrial
VPSHFFKAVYIPATNQAGVYYAPNDESERIDVISIDELTTEIGIDVLPMLDSQSKSQAFDLPLKAGESSDAPAEEPEWMLFVWAILEWLIAQLQA